MRIQLAALLAACATSGCTAVPAGAPPPGLAIAPGEMVAAIRSDAARRSGVAETAVHVKGVHSVVWRDGSLGCPRPDVAYTQALVPGWQLRVAAGDQMLVYHASRRGQWVWCAPEQAQQPLPGGATQ